MTKKNSTVFQYVNKSNVTLYLKKKTILRFNFF